MRGKPILMFALAAALTGVQGAEFSLPLPYVTPWGLAAMRVMQPDYLWVMPTRERVVALTFDDGPSAKYTPALLEALARHHLKATFFVLGSRLDDNTSAEGRRRIAVLREAARQGQDIGFHSVSHRPLTKMSDREIRTEIHAQREQIRKTLGAEAASRVRFFRPPFGKVDARVARVLREENLIVVNASILPGDSYFPRGWSETTPRMAARVGRELHPGAIICLHTGEDIGQGDRVYDMPETAKTIDQLVSGLQKRHYRVVRLGDMIPPLQKSK